MAESVGRILLRRVLDYRHARSHRLRERRNRWQPLASRIGALIQAHGRTWGWSRRRAGSDRHAPGQRPPFIRSRYLRRPTRCWPSALADRPAQSPAANSPRAFSEFPPDNGRHSRSSYPGGRARPRRGLSFLRARQLSLAPPSRVDPNDTRYVRPLTAIRFLYAGQPVQAGRPYRGPGRSRENWRPYQIPTSSLPLFRSSSPAIRFTPRPGPRS